MILTSDSCPLSAAGWLRFRFDNFLDEKNRENACKHTKKRVLLLFCENSKKQELLYVAHFRLWLQVKFDSQQTEASAAEQKQSNKCKIGRKAA